MSDDVPRGPLRNDEELERISELVEAARRARLLRPQCEFVPQRVGGDVLMWCISTIRGVPAGKRYHHMDGWLQQFERDLRDGYFLAV